MKKILIALAFQCVTLTALYGCGDSDRLTEQMITDMHDKMELAAQAHDLNTLMSYYSKDVVISIAMANAPTTTLNWDQYRQAAEQSWKRGTDYQYESKDLTIDIATDGKSAKVSDTVIESIKMFGKTINTTTNETTTVALVEGKPMIIYVKGEMTMDLNN